MELSRFGARSRAARADGGGDGGRAATVSLVADGSFEHAVLVLGRVHFRAARGRQCGGSRKHGANGGDLRVPVPAGTVVYTDDGALLGDLVEEGSEVRVAKGGRGGRGNARFANSTEQTPRFAEKGEPGQERWIRLELRLLADVGMWVSRGGGKSDARSVVRRRRPRSRNYPSGPCNRLGVLGPGIGTSGGGDPGSSRG